MVISLQLSLDLIIADLAVVAINNDTSIFKIGLLIPIY